MGKVAYIVSGLRKTCDILSASGKWENEEDRRQNGQECGRNGVPRAFHSS